MLLSKKMNTLVRVLLLVLMTASSNSLLANGEKTNFTFTKGNNRSFAISFNNPTEVDVKISFKDKNLYTLFKEDYKNITQVSKTFDLKNLPNGIYFVELENEKSIYSQQIEIKNDEIIYNKSDEYTINKPSSYIKDGILYLSTKLSNKEDVEITIFNKSGEIVFEEVIENQNNLKKSFKFLEGRPNDYTITVHYNNRTFMF